MATNRKHQFSNELLAGIIGLVVALGLGGLRLFNSTFAGPGPFNPLRFREEGFGDIVFILILCTPYLMALYSTKLSSGAKWLLLLPAAIAALPAIFISFSLIGFLFIPAIVLLFKATGTSLDKNTVTGFGKALGVGIAIFVIVAVFTAGVSLFQNRNDARGWVYNTYPDGHTEWESVPQTPGHLSSGIIQAPSASGGNSGAYATSDIITNHEATMGGTLLLLAWSIVGLTGVYALKRWPEILITSA